MSIIRDLWDKVSKRGLTFGNTSESYLHVFNQIAGGKVALITEQTAKSIAAVYSCTELIVDTCSLVPFKIYEQTDNGKKRLYSHDQNENLTRSANPNLSYLEFDKNWTLGYLIFGNGYAEIKRNKNGRPVEYVNLDPSLVQVRFANNMAGERIYLYSDIEKGLRIINAENMLHLSKSSWNGLKGDSPIACNNKTIRSGQIVNQYSMDMYENGVALSGYIFGDKPLDKEGREMLRSSFESKYKDKDGQVGILPHGFRYEQLKYNLPMADAQTIESKKLSIQDIARIYRVPLTLLGLSETADNKGESEYNNFLTTTIAPIVILKEAEYNRKIFRLSEKNVYVKGELKGLYRASMRERYEAHRIALNAGFMNDDEVREIEDMNPKLDGTGKLYAKQLNTIPSTLWEEYHKQILSNKTKKNGAS